jgi:nifR3 family TIM-barrel protein
MRIGNINIDAPIFCAPMAGISDLPYRLLMKRQGAGLVFTEMISANGLFYNGRASRELLRTCPEECPLGIQLFGESAERLAAAARSVEGDGELIDLNLGCPVRKVIKTGAGSALLREPRKVAAILKAVRGATARPLTIKIRSGWDERTPNFLEIGRIAENEGVDAVTLHPRSRAGMFGGHADWEQIRQLKEALSIPVIGSGDLFSVEDIKTMFAQTGCDAVMIGRGGYGNPWLASQALDLLAGRAVVEPTPIERLEMANSHFELCLQSFGPSKTLGLMRKHLCWYVRGLENATGFRMRINNSSSIDEMRKLLEGFFGDAT